MTSAAPPAERLGVGRWPFWLVGAVLVATGTGKLLDLEGFVEVLAGYRLMPPLGNRLVAYTLPFVELATGLGLFAPRFRLAAAASATALHALLFSVVLVTLWRGIPVDNCGCFGVFLARPLGVQTLVEDAVMLGVSALALRRALASRALLRVA